MAYLGLVSAHEPFWDAPDKPRKRNSNMVAFYRHALFPGTPWNVLYPRYFNIRNDSFNHYRVWVYTILVAIVIYWLFMGENGWVLLMLFCYAVSKSIWPGDSHFPMRTQLLTHNSFLMGWLIFSCNCYSCCWATSFKLSLYGITGLLVSQLSVNCALGWWVSSNFWMGWLYMWYGCHLDVLYW